MNDKTATILIADDDPGIRQLLRVFLERSNFRVVLAENGDEAVHLAQESVPDLILVDVMMPQMDGYEVCRQLRNDTRTSHLPILMLTSRSTVGDKLTGFECGADDYVTKPFDLDELLARIGALLRRAREIPVRNPLTGLPGNRLLQEELRHRLQHGEDMALLYVDLDNFKAFNDAYGFIRGDEAIQLLARLIRETVTEKGSPNDFIGHIGGDDFAIITSPALIEEICAPLIARFDADILSLYDAEDIERGFLRGYDRHGVPHRFPLMSISIGVVTNQSSRYTDVAELGRTAAEMKHYAKRQSGSSYAVDQRVKPSTPPPPDAPERRGQTPGAVVAIAGAEQDLLQLLRLHLEKAGNRVRLYHSGRELLEAAQVAPPVVFVIDTFLEDISTWELCSELRSNSKLQNRPILLISTDPEDEERAFDAKIDAFLLKPFSLKQFAACVNELVARYPPEPKKATGVSNEPSPSSRG